MFGHRASRGYGSGRHSLHPGWRIQENFPEEVTTELNLRSSSSNDGKEGTAAEAQL